MESIAKETRTCDGPGRRCTFPTQCGVRDWSKVKDEPIVSTLPVMPYNITVNQGDLDNVKSEMAYKSTPDLDLGPPGAPNAFSTGAYGEPGRFIEPFDIKDDYSGSSIGRKIAILVLAAVVIYLLYLLFTGKLFNGSESNSGEVYSVTRLTTTSVVPLGAMGPMGPM